MFKIFFVCKCYWLNLWSWSTYPSNVITVIKGLKYVSLEECLSSSSVIYFLQIPRIKTLHNKTMRSFATILSFALRCFVLTFNQILCNRKVLKLVMVNLTWNLIKRRIIYWCWSWGSLLLFLDNKGALLIRFGFVVNQANKCCSCKYQMETLMKIT